MRMKIVVVGDIDDAVGFSLAGVEEVYHVDPEDEESIRRIVKSLSIRPDVAIVIMTPSVYEKAEELIEKLSSERLFPVFLDIPSEGVVKAIEGMIKKALGVSIKLERVYFKYSAHGASSLNSLRSSIIRAS